MEGKIERSRTQSKNDRDFCFAIRNDTCPNLDCFILMKEANSSALDSDMPLVFLCFDLRLRNLPSCEESKSDAL